MDLIIQDIPPAKTIFAIFEPNIFPIAIILSFFFIALKETRSSGADVPKATIENPIFNSLIPIKYAISKALSTTKLVPRDNPIIEISNMKKVLIKLKESISNEL